MPEPYLSVLCGLFGTTHHHRYSLDRFTDATDLETPNASITKSNLEFHLWFGRLVGFQIPHFAPGPARLLSSRE